MSALHRIVIDDLGFAAATRMVGVRSGMVFAPNRRAEAEAGIARAMRQAGIFDVPAYLDLVARNGAALDLLVDEVTVGETHFLRDPDQWDLLRREILPACRRRRPGGSPRVWSAGCATGEEAYSLAIVLEEEGFAADATVLGTDLSASALRKARAGSYSDWSMRGVSDPFLAQYFHHVRGRRVLVDRIRTRVRFESLNLVGADAYATVGAGGMDVILCRNVLIYFDQATVARIAPRLFDCLADGGVLLTGGADPLLSEHAPFDVEVTRFGLIYRRQTPTPWTAAPRAAVLPPLGRPREATPAAPLVAGPAARPAGDAFDLVTERANADGAQAAERMALSALREQPLDAPLHYLRATLLLALDQADEAERAAARALYLDPSLAVAHFLLGTMRRRRGAHAEARRAFRNVRDLCAARPADEPVRAGGGEPAGSLLVAATTELARLQGEA